MLVTSPNGVADPVRQKHELAVSVRAPREHTLKVYKLHGIVKSSVTPATERIEELKIGLSLKEPAWIVS